MKKNLLAWILLIVLALNSTGALLIAQATSLTLTDLVKTEDGYYVIDSVEAYQVIGSNLTEKYVIVEDLDLRILGNNAIIGNVNNAFKGEIIGRIPNSEIKPVLTLSVNYSDSNVALISVLDAAEAKIKNLAIEGSIKGTQHVGGIVGWIKAGSIENCDMGASVEATGNPAIGSGVRLGGIAGLVNSKGVKISGCVNNGSVIYEQKSTGIGGIAGMMTNFGTGDTTQIIGCVNKSNISTTGYRVGGILGGSLANAVVEISLCANIGNIELKTGSNGNGGGGIAGFLNGKITKSFNSGNITGLNNLGGIAGQSANEAIEYEISNCYNTGNIAGTSNNVAGITYNLGGANATKSVLKYNYNIGNPTVSNISKNPIYYQLLGVATAGSFNYSLNSFPSQTVKGGDTPILISVEEMETLSNFQSETDLDSFKSEVWEIDQNNPYGYSLPQLIDNPHQQAERSIRYEYLLDSDQFIISWKDQETLQYIVEIDNGVDLTSVTTGTNQYVFNNFDGESIYTIRIKIADAVIEEIIVNSKYGGGFGTALSPYLISNLEQLQKVTGSFSFKQTRDIEEALTSPISGFSGSYNGNYKSVLLNIDMPDTSYVGLFSDAASSKIRNVITKGSVYGKTHAGAVVGYSGALIENCVNYATVRVKEFYAGGIAGATRADAKVINCANIGNIFADHTAAGIVGYAYGTIDNCYNAGNVKVSEFGAGIVSNIRFQKCIVSNSYNTGKIQGKDTAGIIISQHIEASTITVINSYNIGEADHAIALYVKEDPNYILENCYYFPNSGKDLSGQAFEVLPKALAEVDLGKEFRNNSEDEAYPYPQLIDNLHIGEHIVVELTVSVSEAGGAVDKEGIRYVKKGETYEIVVSPFANYVIQDILWQGNSIGAFDLDGYVYTTPVITAQSSLSVLFAEDTRLPSIIDQNGVYNELIDLTQLSGKLSDQELQNISGKTAGLAFFKIGIHPEKYNILDYGMVISENNSDPKLGNTDTRVASIMNKFETINKKAGILFYGDYIKEENSYFVRAYLVYHNGTEAVTVYGNPYQLTASKIPLINTEE